MRHICASKSFYIQALDVYSKQESCEAQAVFLAKLATPQDVTQSLPNWISILKEPFGSHYWALVPRMLRAIVNFMTDTDPETSVNIKSVPFLYKPGVLATNKEDCYALLSILMFGGKASLTTVSSPAFTMEQFWRGSETYEKLKCLCAYFITMGVILELEPATARDQMIELELKELETRVSFDQLSHIGRPLAPIILTDTAASLYWNTSHQQHCQHVAEKCLFEGSEMSFSGRLEDCRNCLKVDFANRFPGGGVLKHGAAQEEILYMICPELLLSCLMCPQMRQYQTIEVRNVWRFAEYTGFTRSFKFAGSVEKPQLKSSDFLLMNAERFRSAKDARQFRSLVLLSEINKCYSGFQCRGFDVIATGNWGCGCYHGDHTLKFLIQWIVASATDKTLIYSCFDREIFSLLRGVVARCEHLSVGQLATKMFLAASRKSNHMRFPFAQLLSIDKNDLDKNGDAEYT
eukprot:Gregarina_sp_Poly_1__5780@NODE_3040_length_1434_cov_34_719824_g1924_i0_p1_GENE_NODE_3040_length_1434_cov_34_719824_g1924_i0NODE_3040_length_1434_cov_34_719824_g1924_i0_p1_ORF_typecomplete_len462_score63_75PARG_cat/PF05028_14/1_2e61_NODE_3040_length_1434_cov_34_719824_g1924_i0301415